MTLTRQGQMLSEKLLVEPELRGSLRPVRAHNMGCSCPRRERSALEEQHFSIRVV